MEYNFIINDFEGPLDLLLHLIKEENISIYDIDIEKITSQYLNFINQMEKLDLDIASEYIILAAELMEIKSKLLLPKAEVTEEEEIDPKEQLINRLVEYSAYKEITNELRDLSLVQKYLYSKEPSSLKEFMVEDIMEHNEDGIDIIMTALEKFLERKDIEKPLNTTITHKEYSVLERSIEIKKILEHKKRVNFIELFQVQTKSYTIVTFLAILDLARSKKLIIEQDHNFNDIYLINGGGTK